MTLNELAEDTFSSVATPLPGLILQDLASAQMSPISETLWLCQESSPEQGSGGVSLLKGNAERKVPEQRVQVEKQAATQSCQGQALPS